MDSMRYHVLNVTIYILVAVGGIYASFVSRVTECTSPELPMLRPGTVQYFLPLWLKLWLEVLTSIALGRTGYGKFWFAHRLLP